MIAIIDYGMGNLHSVSKALERLGYDYVITDDPVQMEQASGLLLPGVGAFGDAMKQLQVTDLIEPIKQLVGAGKPILGICLGMQLLFSSSDEGGYQAGLGLLTGHVSLFPGINAEGERYKVPHMGWNQLHVTGNQHPIVQDVDEGYTYFVHSFYVSEMNAKELLAYADYHVQVPAVVGREHVIGMQFHPEKSSTTGMKLLQHFATQCEEVKTS